MDDRIYTAAAEPGETATGAGWVHEIRDLGGIAFLIVRDFVDAIEEGRKPMVPAREAREAVGCNFLPVIRRAGESQK